MNHSNSATPNSPVTSRREFLKNAGGGAGMLALATMLSDQRRGARADEVNDHDANIGKPKLIAKRVIWLFMHGGPSHVDLFDPKPALVKYAGQPVPDSFGMVMTRRNVAKNPLLSPIKPF